MKFRIANFAWMGGLTLAALGLYLVKYSVQDVQREVVSMRSQLVSERDNIHLLNAEWAYLNRPDRLEQLAAAHEDVQALSSVQIIDVQRLPVIEVSAEVAAEKNSLLHEVSASVQATGTR
jgi:hypothetical protein